MPGSQIAVVIVNFRTPDLALACLEAVEEAREELPGLTAILVDGASADGSVERIEAGLTTRGHPDWIEFLPLPINGGFGYANNQALLLLAARAVPPDYVCLLNPDAKPLPGALTRLCALLDAQPGAGAAGAQLQGADGNLQGSAFTFPSLRQEFSRGANTDLIRRLVRSPPVVLSPRSPQRVPWVTGAAVMLRLKTLAEVGLFDDGFFLYFEEVELMHRMTRAGWAMWTVPTSRVMHIGGASTGVASGVQTAVRPHPPYRYESRRRYFVRASGIAGLLVINLAWLGGKVIGLPFRLLRGKTDIAPPRDFSRTLRYGFWPSARDLKASIPRWDEPPGRPPAWSVK